MVLKLPEFLVAPTATVFGQVPPPLVLVLEELLLDDELLLEDEELELLDELEDDELLEELLLDEELPLTSLTVTLELPLL